MTDLDPKPYRSAWDNRRMSGWYPGLVWDPRTGYSQSELFYPREVTGNG